MVDRVGQQLDNYRLRHLLGTGSFGEVYLAEHIRRHTQVAIKILPPLAQDDLRHFLTEARIIRLKHPNIVQVLDFGVAVATPFIVMEYAPNGTLRQRHPRGTRVPLDAVVTYVEQVASALQYAHDEGLIHRDVKPENMLIGAQKQVLLSDFGIAVVVHSTLTQTPEKVIGTARYMAPEQWRGEPLPATDQYALGITVYEWLCGEHPFDGNILQLQFQHTQVPPPPLREKVPTIPREVEQVVMMALAKDPKQRFGSVQAFAHAFAASSAPTKTKEQWLAEGGAHYDAGRYEAALLAYDQALRLDPGDAAVYHHRGWAYAALQHYDKAIDDYSQALQLAPEDIPVYFDRGTVHHALKQYDKAIADYDQVLRRDPKHAAAYRHRGSAHKERAIVDYTQAFTIDPNDTVSRQQRELLLHPRLLSRRAVMMGIGGAVGLAVVSGGLTWLLIPRTLPSTHGIWYDANYRYKKSITIDHGKVSGRSNLSNFPVLISLPANSDLRTTANGGYVQNSNGYDMIFTDSPQITTLDHEIEKYNASTGEIEMWVRLPTLDASADTVIYMYFGNSQIASSLEKKTGVWDSHYLMVQHLQETGNCPVFADSTLNGKNGSCTNSPAPDASGIIGRARDFNGSNTLITEPNSLILKNTLITLSAWFKTSTAGVIVGCQSAGYPSSPVYHWTPILYVSTDDKLRGGFHHNGVGSNLASSGMVTDGKWHYAVLVGNTTTQEVSPQSLYLDGALIGSSNGTFDTTADQQYNQFGGGYSYGWSIFNGSLDELRISNVARSADWIQTEYHNQSSPSTFYTVSSLISR